MRIGAFIVKRLTDETLREHGGSFSGVIETVTVERVRNFFKWRTVEVEGHACHVPEESLEPAIRFTDGYRWIPNQGCRQRLQEALGDETSSWVGRRIRISRERVSEAERQRGKKAAWQKTVTVLDATIPVRDPDSAEDVDVAAGEYLAAAAINWDGGE